MSFPDWYNLTSGKKIVDIIKYGLSCNERLKSERIEKITNVVKERISIFEKLNR